MTFRKIVSAILVAAIFFWAPTFIPARAGTFIGCGLGTATMRWLPTDTAYANTGGIYIPCPPAPHATTPWFAIIFGASVASVILNALYISKTQCRELTMQEAWWSVGVPVFGWVFDQQNNQCNPVPPHHHRH